MSEKQTTDVAWPTCPLCGKFQPNCTCKYTTPELTQYEKIERVAQAIYEARSHHWPWHLATEETREQVLREAHKAVDVWESFRAKT